MITFYFDTNLRTLIQSPGNQAPTSSQIWVYGDNYNCQVYVVQAGQFLPISGSDTLTAILYQPQPNLPEQQLAIIGAPQHLTDANGNSYFLLNVNLATTQLAALVQATNKLAVCQFHFVFNPADLERFSESQDVQTTVNPDPTQGATGGTPVPPGYPTNPNVFEQIVNRGIANGYATLDGTGKVPVAELPTSTAGGDMLKSVYDINNNGIVDTCDTIVSSRVTGLGTAATQNIPATGNASTAQAVMGNDTRLSDTRVPIAHQATHNGGTDPIPLASTAAQGLCPPVDGTTVQIVSGKLTAATTGNGDMLKSVFVTGNPLNTTGVVDSALSVNTHQVPATGNASGAQIVLATDTRLTDARQPQLHGSTHLVAGSDPIALATTAAAGLCPPPDGSSILITGGKLVSASVGVGQHGARYRNSANIAIGAGSVTPLTFDTLVFDTDVFYSAGKFTVPAGQAGYYSVGAGIVWSATTGLTYVMLAIQLNGAANNYPVFAQAAGLTTAGFLSQGTGQNISGILHLNQGDFIQVAVGAAVAATIEALNAVTPHVWILRIS